jgi:hypothetical protein
MRVAVRFKPCVDNLRLPAGFGNTKPAPEDGWQNPGLFKYSAELLETAVALHDPIMRDPQEKERPGFPSRPQPQPKQKD